MDCLPCLFRWAKPAGSGNESHLPSDYEEILKRSVTPLKNKSKEELYSLLCDGILVDGGRKWFSLEKLMSMKCYILSARELEITWGNDNRYWQWKSLPESRFSEVAVLLDVCWLEIKGRMHSRELSPKTYYGAYIILKFEISNYGLDVVPSEVSVTVGDEVISSGCVYLRPNYNATLLLQRLNFLHSKKVLSSIPPEVIKREAAKGRGEKGIGGKEEAEAGERPNRTVNSRKDGWMEVELGKFWTLEGEEGEVNMILKEIKSGVWKSGLIIEGIELRPLEPLRDNSVT